MTRTANCSCGALRIEVSGEPDAVVACRLWRMSAAHRLGVRRRCLLQKKSTSGLCGTGAKTDALIFVIKIASSSVARKSTLQFLGFEL